MSFLVPSLSCLLTLSGSSFSARKKQRTIEEDFEEESEVMPQTKSARQINLEKKKGAAGISGTAKKSVAKNPAPMVSFAKMPDGEYQEYREKNPYLLPRQDNVRNPRFYTNDQELVYDQVYLGQRNAVVKQHRLNLPHLTSPKLKDYFAEAYAMCEEFGLLHHGAASGF